MNLDQQRRYARQIMLADVGQAGQRALMDARVLVIGAGGLGSALISYLAAAGVGHIGIIDHDRVELSNLARQIIHETGDIGRLKVESASDRIAELNPDVEVTTYPFALTAENVGEIIARKSSHTLSNSPHAGESNPPFADSVGVESTKPALTRNSSSGISTSPKGEVHPAAPPATNSNAGLSEPNAPQPPLPWERSNRTYDSGEGSLDIRLSTLTSPYHLIADGCDNFATRFLVNQACITHHIPLVSAAIAGWAGQVMTIAPHLHSGTGCYQCLVSPHAREANTCRDSGIIGPLAGIIGSMQALEVINTILGRPALVGKLVRYDARTMQQRVVQLPRDPACPICG